MRCSLAVIIVLFAAGCSRSPTEPTGSVWVSGHVLAFASNTGVPGATVIFDPSLGSTNDGSVPGSAATRTVTDINGFYTLPLSAIGRYWTWVDGEFVGINY